MSRQYNFNISEKSILEKTPHFFFHLFSHYLDLLFDSLLEHVLFTVNLIFKNTEAIFLGKVFSQVFLLYDALEELLDVELILMRKLGVHKSKSALWGIFLKVSESLLMVLATTSVPCSLIGIGYVCYNSHQVKYSTKHFFRCLMARLHSRKQVEAHFTALEALITDKQGHICHERCDHILPYLPRLLEVLQALM